MTNLGTWIDTETPEHPWAGTQDLLWGMRQRRTVIRRRIILGPGVATIAATCKSPGKKKLSSLKMATSTATGTNPRGNNTQPKNTMTGKRKLIWKLSWLESLDWIHRDVLDSDTLDSYVEEELLIRACTRPTWDTRRLGDALNQARRGRGFWPVIAIPAPDGRSATLAVRNTSESFRGKGKDSKSTTHKGKSKGSKSGKSGKGGKGKSSGKSFVKGKGDPLKQRLASRTQCRLCVKKITKLMTTCLKPNAV